MKLLEKIKRTITGEVMNFVLKFVPKDGFKLSDDLLNKEYVVTNVEEYDATDKIKSFSVTLENSDGDVIVLSASAIKRSRVIGSKSIALSKMFGDNKNIILRSQAEELWAGSQFFHSAFKMRKGEDFEMPAKLRLRYAVVFEEKGTGNPLLSPYMYDGYSRLVKEYSGKGTYPTMDDFRMELKKGVNEGRLPFLPVAMQEPTPYSWVKGDVSEFRHILVWERV